MSNPTVDGELPKAVFYDDMSPADQERFDAKHGIGLNDRKSTDEMLAKIEANTAATRHQIETLGPNSLKKTCNPTDAERTKSSGQILTQNSFTPFEHGRFACELAATRLSRDVICSKYSGVEYEAYLSGFDFEQREFEKSKSEFHECTLPAVGSAIKVRADGVNIHGLVTGNSEKDGKPIIDYLGPCMLSNGQLSKPTMRWAWVDQLID